MDPYAVSLDTHVAVDANSPKQENGDLLGGMNQSQMSSRQNLLGAAEMEIGEGGTSFPTSLSPFEVVWGNRSDPDITTPK